MPVKLIDVEPEKNVTDLVVRIISIAPPRIIQTRAGRKTMLKEVLVADDSGSTILSLWGFNEGNDLSAGMVIRIVDGWAKEWQMTVQYPQLQSLELQRNLRFLRSSVS
jgi:ssDNA-binding replication factor A large subunit